MNFKHIYRMALSLFALLIVSLQSSAISHAAQYDDAPHEHDGVVCVVDAITSDTQVVLPAPLILSAPAEQPDAVFETVFNTAAYVTPPGRAPPPRSPPYTLF